MGCDIHASVEWRRHEANDGRGEWWVHVLDAEFLPRDYHFFGCLVQGHSRREVEGGVPERGLPPLPSDIRRDVEWYREHPRDEWSANAVCGADHTFSWLTSEEYRAAIALYGATRNAEWGDLDPEYIALAEYMDSLAKHGPVRIVFGFDN